VYTIEILNKKTNKPIGPTFFTGVEYGLPKLTDGMIAAQAWLKKEGLPAGEYRIVPRIVGCL